MGKRLLVVDSDRRFIQDHKSTLESAFEVDFLYATEGALTAWRAASTARSCSVWRPPRTRATPSAPPSGGRGPGDLKIALISAKATEEEYARHRGTKGKADLYLHKPITSAAPSSPP